MKVYTYPKFSLLTAGLIFTLFTGFKKQETSPQAVPLSKPNIIIFISDDHGYEDAGAYGAKVVRTPHLDALAKEGLRFTNAFANTPNCVPSRAVLNTGLMPARNGAHPNHSKINAGIKTLPVYMQELGYNTVLAGKDHLWPRSAYPYTYIKKHDHDYHLVDSVLSAQAHAKPGAKPLFLIVATDNPHVPWPKNEGYDPDKVDLPPYLVDTKITRQVRAKYFTDVTDMDKTLGKTLESVDKHGLTDNTLFIYISDHGPQWPHGKWNLYDAGIKIPMVVRWPGKVKKGNTSDVLLPLVDFLPTLLEAAGGETPAGIDGRSFMPVLTQNKTTHRDTIYSTYTADTRYGKFNYYPIRSIRTRKYKYILNLEFNQTYTTHITNAKNEDGKDYWDSWVAKAKTDPKAAELVKNYQHRPVEELYDLEKDPYELNNIAANSGNKALVLNYRKQMVQWLEDQNDQMGLTLFFNNVKYNKAVN